MQTNIGIFLDGFMIIINGMNIEKMMLIGMQYVKYLLMIVIQRMGVPKIQHKVTVT